MKTLKNLTIAFFLSVLYVTGQAQTISTINVLAEKHQSCLDSGIDMLGCSKSYYFQMDSMLNVVYNKLRASLSQSEKDSLKKEQLNWLKKRDLYFEKQNKEFREKAQSGEWGSDMAMITYDNQAEYVKDRVIILIKKLHKR